MGLIMANKKEQVAFELENPNGFVTQANQIGMGGQSVEQQVLGRDTNHDSNSLRLENKVNALIHCLQVVIKNVAWINNVPYRIPTQLLSDLNLSRMDQGQNASSICGIAVCGKAICGTN